MADISLDEIIKKKNSSKKNKIFKSGKTTKGTKAKGKRFGKKNQMKVTSNKKNWNIVTDARNKIVKKNKRKIRDARDRLGQLARKGDARDRLGRLARQGDARDRLNQMVPGDARDLINQMVPGDARDLLNQMVYDHHMQPVFVEEMYSPNVVYVDEYVAPIIKAKQEVISVHLMKGASKIPDNAASMHPVMLLHQMKPGIQYTNKQATGEDNMSYFYVSAEVDGQEFTGEGSSIKKAKFILARDAIYALYGVQSVFQNPA